ncbi:PEPxxWA-CTERM sorting domain-containing protein [Nitrosomonas sp. Nm166]|uniref:PEPxxWA-CTERM sorting domain-containing protein n=1 Tax=Nitrosomonas sp. Nm166 TaxID=1881054 RepID=UPI0008F0F389|nr:PEPxxWA-CTERM sorting domain-containing protein [Nitrosomonas sp. Nm166]SFE65151.1 PEP-CTERM protein-sorting domain-containing protein [Nitrosomonas sp. Nm166]
MKNYLRLIAASVVVGLGSGVTANARGFEGQTINYPPSLPDLITPYSNAANGNHAVDFSAGILNVVDGFGISDFNSSGFAISFTSGSSFTSNLFNGFMMGSYTSFNLSSNTGVLGMPTLSFKADHLNANWQGTHSGDGDLFFTVNTSDATNFAPEPETHAMLIVGFGMMGYSLRRRRMMF